MGDRTSLCRQIRVILCTKWNHDFASAQRPYVIESKAISPTPIETIYHGGLIAMKAQIPLYNDPSLTNSTKSERLYKTGKDQGSYKCFAPHNVLLRLVHTSTTDPSGALHFQHSQQGTQQYHKIHK